METTELGHVSDGAVASNWQKASVAQVFKTAQRAPLRDWVFGALTLSLVVPLWAVRSPTFQDFPQYVALARTLADYSVPELGFARYFSLNFDT
jgi:hypothetical protein